LRRCIISAKDVENFQQKRNGECFYYMGGECCHINNEFKICGRDKCNLFRSKYPLKKKGKN